MIAKKKSEREIKTEGERGRGQGKLERLRER